MNGSDDGYDGVDSGRLKQRGVADAVAWDWPRHSAFCEPTVH